MAQTPEGGDDSKLELPSLSIFRRRKKKTDGDASDGTRTEIPGTPASAPSSDADAWADESPAHAPDESPTEAREPRAELGSESDEPTADPDTDTDTDADADADETVEEPAAEENRPVQSVEPVAETSVEADAPPAVEQPPGQTEPETGAEPGTMFPNAVHDTGSDVNEGGDYDDTDQADGRDQHVAAAVPAKKTRERKPRKELSLPALDGRIAAPITGLLVGLAGVALTFITQRGCEAVKGTGSCGGVGLFLLIAILALMVLLGAALLKAWSISDPTNSSFLAVGLVAVLAMLFFLPYIDRWFMVIVIPVLSALTYLLSWWVTHKFIEGADGSSADAGAARGTPQD